MRISIIGSGVVGYAIGKGLLLLGNEVIFSDINIKKVLKLRKEGLKAYLNGEHVRETGISFICVPTPTVGKEQDLTYVKSAVKSLSECLKEKKEYHLIVIKSTVLPKTTEKVLLPIIEKYSKKKVGKEIGLCMNPEFMREKHALEEFLNPDRIVIGEFDKKSGDLLQKLYRSFKCPIVRTDLRTAEMIKYASNVFYATRISFFNEIHSICKNLSIDSNQVREAVLLDRNFGRHPWKHGHSFGGTCLPKDLRAFITLCNDGHVHDPKLLKCVQRINEEFKNDEKRGR
jgi:UDPglucose 6-dehydrogenase